MVSTIIMLIAFMVLMYFMMIKPQKKQQEKRQEMMSSLQKGDKIVTIGGLHGVVDSVDSAEKTVTLDCDGVYLVFSLSAVGRVLEKATAQVQEATKQPEEQIEEQEAAKEE